MQQITDTQTHNKYTFKYYILLYHTYCPSGHIINEFPLICFNILIIWL